MIIKNNFLFIIFHVISFHNYAAAEHTILRSWAVKDFAPNVPQYVQIFRWVRHHKLRRENFDCQHFERIKFMTCTMHICKKLKFLFCSTIVWTMPIEWMWMKIEHSDNIEIQLCAIVFDFYSPIYVMYIRRSIAPSVHAIDGCACVRASVCSLALPASTITNICTCLHSFNFIKPLSGLSISCTWNSPSTWYVRTNSSTHCWQTIVLAQVPRHSSPWFYIHREDSKQFPHMFILFLISFFFHRSF